MTQQIHKATGDIIPIGIDWTPIAKVLGATLIVESHWTVDVGTILIGTDGRTSYINGLTTVCGSIYGGAPDEYAVLNNSVLFDTGDKKVIRIQIMIDDGAYEPGTPPVIMLPDGLANVTALSAFVGAMPGNTIWVDTTTMYTGGTAYIAVPNTWNGAPVDGLNVVQGTLVKWIDIHLIGAYTGVLPSRTISTSAPLTGGGDLSTNRTLGISAATTGAAGSMSPTQVTNLNALMNASLLTDADESATLANSDQLLISDGDPSSHLSIDHNGAGNWNISALYGTTSTTYMRGDSVSASGTTNKLAKYTGSGVGIGNSSITDDGSNVTIGENATCSQNLTVTKDLVIGYQTIDRSSASETIQTSTAANGGLIHVAANDAGSANISYSPHFASATQAPRIFRDAGGFRLTGSGSSQDLAFYTAIHGIPVPNDGTVRSILGKLTLGWLGNGHLTNGAAQEYLFALGMLADGTLNNFFITIVGSVLNGGQAAPTITQSFGANSFTFTIRAASAGGADVTRFCYWIQFEWAKS